MSAITFFVIVKAGIVEKLDEQHRTALNATLPRDGKPTAPTAACGSMST